MCISNWGTRVGWDKNSNKRTEQDERTKTPTLSIDKYDDIDNNNHQVTWKIFLRIFYRWIKKKKRKQSGVGIMPITQRDYINTNRAFASLLRLIEYALSPLLFYQSSYFSLPVIYKFDYTRPLLLFPWKICTDYDIHPLIFVFDGDKKVLQ